jgi:hypothetical protein
VTANTYTPKMAVPRTAVQERAARLVRGRDTDAPWVRPALLGLLAATA